MLAKVRLSAILLALRPSRSWLTLFVLVGALLISLFAFDRFMVRQQAAFDATTFTVTNTDDNGPGSLRQAILDSNTNAGTDTIAFNISGSGVHTISPTTALPNVVDPVVIDGYTQPGSSANTLANGDNAVLLIELSGANFNSNTGFPPGLRILASNCVVRGLVINRFADSAISFGTSTASISGNLVAGNFLGTDPTGMFQRGNNIGIRITFATNTTIGGTTPAARNLISGNNTGVSSITGSSGITVQGNFIGTNASGTAALGNSSTGILAGGTGNDVIGGTADEARNIIAATQNNAGIIVQHASASSVTIQNNFIGTDVTGTIPLGNFFGIWLNNGPSSVTCVVGGNIPNARNLISGNRSDGILVAQSTSNSQILGNYIGTDVTGTKPLPNEGNGLRSESSAGGNRIGGPSPGDGNTIAFNGKNGVLIFSGLAAINNSIRRNSIFSNGLLGIDLNGDGVTLNDSGDGDIGANNLQNYPILTSVTSDGAQTTITGTLNSVPNSTYSLHFYSSSACDGSGNGEGATPFGFISFPVTTNANGDGSFGIAISIPLAAGHVITATATNATGSTSEFSPCMPGNAIGSVQFESATLKVIENVGFVTINVLRKGGTAGALPVEYAAADITATAGADYLPVAGSLTFNDGEASKSFDIPILDDNVAEQDEAFVIRLKNGPYVDSISSPVEEVVTIQDHTVLPVLSINSISVAEGETGTKNATFTVSLGALTGRTVTVDYQTLSSSAISGVDFQPVNGTLTFAARQNTQTITVPIIGDTTDEFNEIFRVQLSNANNGTIPIPEGQGTIVDNDAPPPISIRDVTLVEGNSSTTFARFNVSLSQVSGKFTCVQASTADGTATAASGDYHTVGGSLTNPPAFLGFDAGQTSSTFSVQVRGDVQFEPNETFLANIIPCNSDSVIGRGQAVATIINDDPDVPPSISITDVNVSDGSGAANAVFDVALSAASTQTVTVDFATGEGTATASDFTAMSGTLTFDPGVTHRLVTVPIVPDANAEGNETFTVNLTNPAGGTLADSQGLATISDGPPSQTPFLTIDDITVLEGASGANEVEFRVTLSQASAQPISFQYTVIPGTATENVDYMKVFGAVSIFPGNTKAAITVPIVGDQIPEPDETFFLNLSNPDAATIADSQGKGTIINYVQPSLQFSTAGLTVGEGDGSALVTITRSANNLTTSKVEVATANGSAAQRTDYTISAAFLTFLPGESSKTFRIPIIDDVYVEGNETFDVVLSNPVGAAVGTANNTITIADNDSSPPASNPLDNADARFFVREHYNDFLSRQPDQGGFDFWSGVITQCGSDAACLLTKRIDVSNAFFYELEYQQTAAYVFRLYRAAFGNNQPFPNPDATNSQVPPAQQSEARKIPSYAAFSTDRARLIGSANLAQDQLALANAFVQRPEFISKYPANLTAMQFVDALLANLMSDSGVDLGSQRNALITQFNQDGAGMVLYRVADDNIQINPINNRPFIDAEYNRAFVASQYFGYLRRNSDIAGFLFWLGQVNGAPLRDVPKQHAMVCSFITSTEYQLRFSSVITHSNTECQ